MISVKPGTYPLPVVKKEDGSIHHVNCPGSRQHVIWYTSQGQHCTEPDCEINRQMEIEDIEQYLSKKNDELYRLLAHGDE